MPPLCLPSCWGTEQCQYGVMSLSCQVPCAFLPATCWGTEQHCQYGVMSVLCQCHVNVMHPVPFFWRPAGELNNISSMVSCHCHVPCTLLLPAGELNNTISIGSGHCHVHVVSPIPSFCRVRTEKSFKNSQTIVIWHRKAT